MSNDSTPVINAAAEAYRRNYLPVPLRPGEKRPAEARWTHRSYADVTEVRNVFTQVADELDGVGVGVLLGDSSHGLVDIDLDHPKALRMAKHVLPETPMVSGRGSRTHSHFWYQVEGEAPAYRKFTMPDGDTLLELRSTGHQTVVPPSIHPDGEPYVWNREPWGGDEGPTPIKPDTLEARVLTLAMAATLLDAWPQRGSRHDAYLALAGGLLRYGGVQGETGGIHPLWERQLPQIIRTLAEETHDGDGADARISEVVASTIRKLKEGKRVQGFPTLGELIGEAHTDLVYGYVRDIESVLGFASRQSQKASEIDLIEESRSNGSKGAGGNSGTRKGENGSESGDSGPESAVSDPLADREEGWSQVDLHEYLVDPNVGPQPGVLYRNDGIGLLYEGRVNSIYGSTETAKTWLMLNAMVELMRRGETVMLIDCEDGPSTLVERLRLLSTSEQDIRERFAYINPDTALGALTVDRYGQPSATKAGQRNDSELIATLDLMKPSLIVVDGVTALYGLHSLNPNDTAGTDRVTSWLRWLTDGFSRTVVMIDHTAKNTPPGGTPTGSQHKLAMVQGAALHVVGLIKPRVGHVGESLIYIGKDRPGKVRKHQEHPEENLIATMVVNSVTPGETTISVQPPPENVAYPDASKRSRGRGRPPGRVPGSQVSVDSATIAGVLSGAGEPLTKRKIGEALLAQGLGLSQSRIDEAVKNLVEEGRVENTAQARRTGVYRLVPPESGGE